MAHPRALVAWMRRDLAAPSSRGVAFWLVTALLGLLLPAPVAVAVVVARLRRAALPGVPGALAGAGGPGSPAGTVAATPARERPCLP